MLSDVWRQIAAFEQTQSAEQRRRHGVFYTPRWLAEAVARIALDEVLQATPLQALTVLDIACGAGGLLLAAAQVIASHRADHREEAVSRRHFEGIRLVGRDVDPVALAEARRLLSPLGVTLDLQQADSLLEDAVVNGPNADAIVGNPPFGSLATLRRGDPRRAALRDRYPEIWQDKSDQSAFFVWRGTALARTAAWVVPSALFAGDKSRRFRLALGTGYRVRFLELRDAVPFSSAAISVGLLHVTQGRSASVVGVRLVPPSSEASVREVVDAFARHQPVASSQALTGAIGADQRWNVADPEAQVCIEAMSSHPDRLGDVYMVGKGMETGCNRAFEVDGGPPGGAQGAFVRRRIRGKEIGVMGLSAASTWMLYTPVASRFEDLPVRWQQHLEAHRAALEARAAFQRGDCEWWRYSWPLHQKRYGGWRVMTPYRSRTHRFTVVGPGEGIGLTDTTSAFVDSHLEARALALYLNSAPVALWYGSHTKHTGAGLMEFFENQLRDVPLPRGWSEFWPDLATSPDVDAASQQVLACFGLGTRDIGPIGDGHGEAGSARKR